MTVGELLVCCPEDQLGLAAQMMLWGNVRYLPVLNQGEVVGVISEGDILRGQVGDVVGRATERVEDAMHAPAVTATSTELIAAAVSRMLSRHLGCLPVVDQRELVGMLTMADLLPDEIENTSHTPPKPSPRRVRSLMRPSPAVAAPGTPLFDAAGLMARRGVHHLPVVKSDRTVTGILSDRDVRAALGDPRRLAQDEGARKRARTILVGDVMSKSVVTVREDEPMASAATHFVHGAFGALPVVDSDAKLVGILSYLDVLTDVQ
jgi:CBS domain-containing protein